MKKREYLYIALLLIFCPFSLLAFVLSIADIDVSKLIFSEGHLLSVIGIIVSTVGLAFTVYFVVLAISARKMQDEIEKTQYKYNELEKEKQHLVDNLNQLSLTKNEIKTEFDKINVETQKLSEYLYEIKKQKKDVETLLKDYAQSLFDSLEIQITLAELSKSLSLRNDLALAQARLSYSYPMLDRNTRITLLHKLANIGEVKDINNIEMIIYNPDEGNEIKENAKLVVEEMRKRLLA